MFSALFDFVVYTVNPYGLIRYLTGDVSSFWGIPIMLVAIVFWLAVVVFAAIAVWSAIWQLWEIFGPFEYYDSKTFVTKGKVVGLNYESAKSTTSVGPIVGGNGGVAVMNSYSAAKYNVIIKAKALGKWIIDDEDLFDAVENCDELELHYYYDMRKRKDGKGTPKRLDTNVLKVVTKDGDSFDV